MRRVLVTPAAAALAIGGQRHSVYAMFSSLDPFYADTIDDVRSILETATLPTGVEGAPTPTP